jgi:modification target Cys-rich repeat protein
MYLELVNKDMETLDAAQDVIEKMLASSSSEDPKPVTFCGYGWCSGSCSGTCSGSCYGSK